MTKIRSARISLPPSFLQASSSRFDKASPPTRPETHLKDSLELTSWVSSTFPVPSKHGCLLSTPEHLAKVDASPSHHLGHPHRYLVLGSREEGGQRKVFRGVTKNTEVLRPRAQHGRRDLQRVSSTSPSLVLARLRPTLLSFSASKGSFADSHTSQ